MMAAILSLTLSLLIQASAPEASADFFAGRWRAMSKTGPETVEITSNDGKLVMAVAGQSELLEGRLYIDNQVKPVQPFAVVAQNARRLFIARRDGQDIKFEMFSALPGRPATFWSERFVRVK